MKGGREKRSQRQDIEVVINDDVDSQLTDDDPKKLISPTGTEWSNGSDEGPFDENGNQNDGNRHEALLPAMSTLVIIAHVKDGADLARQHHLPQSIIDFILQHHGTTLVEYFYDQANKQSEQDPDAAEVDEGSYRYPGPKPRTKEAAVLMLADAVESASRTLQDPAPARIESLVHDIAIKRLMDGQFDQCGLTLKELRQIEDSLVKSITAMYHGRIKYPDQQTA